jgi:hypothetical protein
MATTLRAASEAQRRDRYFAGERSGWLGRVLATVVDVLIEVPAMLSVVAIVNGSRQWYDLAQA